MIPQKSLIFIFTLLLLSMATLLIAGCRTKNHNNKNADRVEIITTIFPLSDMIRQLGRERVTVKSLLPPGASPHNFEPSVEQAKAASRALVFVYVGGGLDDWAVKIALAGADRTLLLDLYENALERGWRPPGWGSSEGPAMGDFNNRFNPHLWLDPLTTRDYLCPALAEILIKANPENETYYRANLKAYQAELTALDKSIRSEFSGLPERSFISVHAAWQYFAARYNLKEAAVISDFPGQEPSAKWLSNLIGLCCKHQVRVVSAEPQFSSKVAQTIAREIEGEIVLLDPLGGAGLAQRDSYLNLMRYNAVVLRDALSN